MNRTWTVVGHLCRSEAEALKKMVDLRANETTAGNDWGLVRIRLRAGDTPAEVGKIRVPPPPALMKRLEGLLSDREVRRTDSGREALRLVRTILKKRR